MELGLVEDTIRKSFRHCCLHLVWGNTENHKNLLTVERQGGSDAAKMHVQAGWSSINNVLGAKALQNSLFKTVSQSCYRGGFHFC
jgi:hypothetical protein